ncbi:MarR family transcriptional regulator [Streptomyces triticisoli]|uniref:MarR family transcriptional regulator n=1 Tax=Streptomyces triticisoli TaxID=2182797 RepID=UPI002FCDC0D8
MGAATRRGDQARPGPPTLVRPCRQPGEAVSQRDLADDLTLTSSGVTRLVDRMEETGLVRRVPSPEDRGAVRVEPAGQGRAAALREEID